MSRIIKKAYSYDDVLILPKYNKIKSRKDVCFKTKVTKNYELSIPILAANMDTVCESEMAIAIGKLGGLGVLHRFLKIEEQVVEVKKIKKENIIVAAAIGVKDYKNRVPKLVDAGVNILVLDVAHGHSKYAGKTLDWIKENKFKVDVMVGNIATKDAAEYFVSKKADAIKVGIGPGSVCTTRIMTGVGIPQITALGDVYEATQGRVPVCADGGIKVAGDLTKAIGAGADTIMLGSVLAGTDEAPGNLIIKNEKKYKEFRGMASYSATVKKNKLNGQEQVTDIYVEGESTLVEYKGSVVGIINKMLAGLASGMTYTGSLNIEALRGKADFVEITTAGMQESGPHGKKDI